MKLNEISPCPSRRLLLFLCALAPLAPSARADGESGLVERSALAVQAARNAAVQARGKQVWYTQKFDLSGLPHYQPKEKVDGTIRIWGNNYLTDGMLGNYWKDGFQKYHPNAQFTFDMPTTATGIPALTCGVADLGMSRKPAFLELLSFERRMNHEPLEIAAVTGSFDVPGWTNGFAIFVNKQNPIPGVSMDQLDGIFGGPRAGGWVGTEWHPEFARGPEKNIRKWGQLGLTGEWADKTINVYAVSMRYNSTALFSDLVLKSSDQYNENVRDHANYKRPDGTLVAWFDQMKEELGEDKYGIDYSVANAISPKTRIIPVAPGGSHNFVTMSLETEQDLSYPLATQQYFYVDQKPGEPLPPKVREFLLYVLSQEGQLEVERDGKYLPLTAGQVQEMLKKIN